MFDFGIESKLPAGTRGWTAPEWKERALTGLLKKTDVYSYGLVFASIIFGRDIVEFTVNEHGGGAAGFEYLESMKQHDTIHEYLEICFQSLNDAIVDDPGTIVTIFGLTLRRDPNRRVLREAISRLSNV